MNRSFSVRWLALVLIAGITPNLIHAQTAPIASQPTQNLIGYQLGECEADQRVWQEIVQVTDPKGNTLFQTNQAYVELASGLNYWDATSKQWLESKEEIDAYPGGAIAQYGQHKVIFASDLNSAVAIDQQTPDGQRLQSHVIGLGYFDPASGKSVSIAVVADSTGQIIPPNQVIYTNAFTGVQADVCFTYTKAGLEQDVILRGRLPASEMFGLSSATARLQVLTEFVSAPQPVIEAVQLPASAGGLADDQTLDFGAMKMRPGKAFVVGATKDDLAGIPVRKQWVTIDGRTILIEDVAISALAGRLASLTAPVNQRILNARKDSVLHVVSTRPLLPAPKAGKAAKPAMKIAKRQASSQGVVLDYTTMTDRTNFTFQADTTYYISGTVNLSGYTTVEGGTVLKYANTNTAKVRIYGSAYSSFNLQTSPYHPAIFTSKNDNTVGEAISGSTGSPAPGNATYLEIHGDGYYSPPVRNARFLFASNAISQVDFYNTLSPVWDCQFVQCGTAFRATPTYSSYPLELHNVLFSQCGVLFADASGGEGQGVIGEQVTADQIGFLLYSSGYYGGCNVFLTNSILTAVGPIYPVTGSTNLDTSHQQDTSTGIYQSVGAANFYLADNTYRQHGNPNITPAMLTELANKTTWPPTVLTNGFVPGSVLTRNSQVVRDNTGTPDLGYHYDPLDYCWSGLYVTYNLTLTNGVAVGFYGSSGLNGGSLLVSQGTPLNLNHLAFYSAVQEQPASWGTRLSANYLLNGISGTLKMSFTDLSLAGVSSESLTDNNLAFNLILWDSQWLAVKFNPSYAPYSSITMGFTNNLMQRCTLNFGSCGTAYAVNFRNNLFLYGSLNFALCSYNYNFYQLVTLEDNLFAKCAFGYSTYYGYGPRDISYNGYYQTTVLHGSAPSGYGPAVSGGDVLVTNLDFQVGPLGNYYYPATGTNLARLIDAGNKSASAASLADHTTQTNQTPDTGTVDIGFHYSINLVPPTANDNNYWSCPNEANSITLSGWSSNSSALYYTVLTYPTHGTLTNTGSAGSPYYTYTPTNCYEGVDSFTFKVNDGYLDSAPAAVTFTIADTVTAYPPSAQTCRGTTTQPFTLNGGNCNGNLTYTLLSNPANGYLTGDPGTATDPTYTYTPNDTNFLGTDSFTYKVSNECGDSATGTVTITVTEDAVYVWDYPNPAPTCRVTPVNITLYGYDNCDEQLAWALTGGPQHGSLESTGGILPEDYINVIYTPNDPNFTGTDSFTYVVYNGYGDSATDTVTIAVGDQNANPNSQTVMAGTNQSVNITLTANSSLGCTNTLTYNVVNGPTNGTLSVAGTNLTYMPDTSYEGLDSFTFEATDGVWTNSPNVGTVTIFVVAGPTNLTAQCNTNGPGIMLNWSLDDAVQYMEQQGLNINGYNIYRSAVPNVFTTNDIIYTSFNSSQTNYLDTSALPGSTYYYVVTFTSQDSGITYESPYSGEVSTTVCDLPPPIRPGFYQNILVPNDDDCYGGGNGDNGNYLTNLLANIGFSVNFFGTTYTNLYVNNNGNVTFGDLLSAYTPTNLVNLVTDPTATATNIIAPFWADVDTRAAGSGLVTYGTNTVNGHAAFAASWVDVGYYEQRDDKLNAFQLVLIDRPDRASGDYDVEFNYAQIQWETGNASGGSDGLGGSSARAGYASASGLTFELNGSGTNSAFLDTNLVTGLIHTNYNSGGVLGRYVYPFHNGTNNLAHP